MPDEPVIVVPSALGGSPGENASGGSLCIVIRNRFASIGLIATLSLAGATASADYSVGPSLTVTEDFNGLISTGTTTYGPNVGDQVAIAGTGFAGSKVAGNATTNLALRADAGTSNAGSLYSYGATSSTERALGTLASGSVTPAFGAVIVNNSGFDLVSFALTVDREQWRSSTSSVNTITFAYGVSGGAITAANFLTSTALTNLATFDLVGAAPVTTNGALDGNANAITLVGTIPVSLAQGQSLFIRWTDVDNTGSDAGLAIDNLRLVGVVRAVPEPGSLALLGLGLGAAVALRVRRRRPTA